MMLSKHIVEWYTMRIQSNTGLILKGCLLAGEEIVEIAGRDALDCSMRIVYSTLFIYILNRDSCGVS